MTKDQKQNHARQIIRALMHQPHPITTGAEAFIAKYANAAQVNFAQDLLELLATALSTGRDQPWGKEGA